jgi:hypothetical protein
VKRQGVAATRALLIGPQLETDFPKIFINLTYIKLNGKQRFKWNRIMGKLRA